MITLCDVIGVFPICMLALTSPIHDEKLYV
jgi:hypothetical protein